MAATSEGLVHKTLALGTDGVQHSPVPQITHTHTQKVMLYGYPVTASDLPSETTQSKQKHPALGFSGTRKHTSCLDFPYYCLKFRFPISLYQGAEGAGNQYFLESLNGHLSIFYTFEILIRFGAYPDQLEAAVKKDGGLDNHQSLRGKQELSKIVHLLHVLSNVQIPRKSQGNEETWEYLTNKRTRHISRNFP